LEINELFQYEIGKLKLKHSKNSLPLYLSYSTTYQQFLGLRGVSPRPHPSEGVR